MLNRPRTHVPRQALRQGLLAELAELRIPSRQPVPPNDPAPSLYAIGLSAISNGLYVFVPPYSGMNNGDYIEVFWDNSNIPAASDTVNDGNKNTAIGLPLPASSFANGRFTPYYRVTRGGSGLPLYSLTQNIWVKLNPPGGLDPNPGTPEHENLRAPILPEDVRDGLDNDRAALGVDVTIPPYPQMAEYDRIDFSWGGSGGGIRHIYTVQPDEVGRPVVVHITESEILSAGDGDVLLMYTVIDAALNRTADGKWSLTTRLNVLANNSHLDAPYIVEVNENEDIDLTELGDADATAVVYADNIDFAVGDDITFTWAGFDAYGTALTPYTDTQRVTRVPRPVLFIVPNATVVASAQGRAVLSFMLHKSNGETIDSRHSTVRIVGKAASDLPPPIVTPSLLPADVVRADVTVLAYDGMDVGDHVTLIWTGMGADNRLVDYRPTFDVTQAWVGQDLPPFPIDGPAYIAPLAGGRVTVSYQVDYAAGPALVRESAPLELPVGDAGNRLPPPFVIEAPDGIFDPTLTLANVRIPGTVLVANDRVNLTWVGDTTGTYTDSAIARTTGQALNMVVPAARITGNRQITVSYAVNGGPASTTLTLRVAASGDLPIPEVDQANNGVLALGNVPASGATGRVRPYTGIATNDQVTLFLEEPAGTVQWQRTETVTSTTQDLTYTIPRSVIAGLLNRTVQLRYAVQLAGVSKGQSAVAHLSVEDGAASERPVIEVIRNPQNVDIPNGGTTGATSLTLSGTAARDQRVQIFDGTNASLGIANVNSMGRWSLPVAGLSSGPHTLTAEGLYDDFPVSDVYRLTITLSGHLLVMGGRSTSPMRGGFHGSAALRTSRRRLHALDATTKKSILARWRYQFELDSTGITATDFLDLEPDAVLYIDTDDDQVILRPRNILGNGVSTTSYGGAFVAQRDEGNLVAWGSTNMGGTLPPVLPGLTDIVEFKTSFGAFAARRNNGKNGASGAVVAWGNSGYGGTFP
ncbi:MAG TPA: hypothetical protein VIM98_14755, partial [Dyella sp.]|uniref:hypothetical protein n=1 Tax=Dyella sp. TaxID=1869338 RepID=UPI002F9400C7